MTLGTNLIIHHSITDILGHASELNYVIGAVQEPRDLASLCQWDEVSENVIQFPSKPCTLDRSIGSESVGLPFKGLPPPFLLDITFGNRFIQRFCQPFNSGLQRFYRVATRHRLLRRP